ncbi:MAG: hypothetical protein ACE5K8_04480 [Candidatus Zixiibacteriota bacterium]
MGKMNVGRIIGGGLLAGLILNIGEFILNMPILGKRIEEAMLAKNLPVPGSGALILYAVLGFVLGIVVIWLYSAIRPRFGAGPKTAVIAGLAVWFVMWLWMHISMIPMGLFPTSIILISLIWGFFEVPIATLIGAWVYKEA